ncbi:hypothetical protein [Flavobacterium sp. GNP002]
MSKDKAADYFSRHQNDECHITSDGRVFHTIGSAQSFAAGLKDAKIDSFKRTDVEKETSEDSQNQDKESRFKSRVDRLIALGFERNVDVFAQAEKGASIDATAVYEITDEEFETGLNPLIVNVAGETKTIALELLKAFDPATATYEDAKVLVNSLALETQSKKKEDLFAAIEAFKKTINLEVQE